MHRARTWERRPAEARTTRARTPCRTVFRVTPDPARRTTRSNRHAYSPPDWWSPTRGSRLPRGIDDLVSRCRALLLVQPDAVFTGPTAAALWGCSVSPATASIEVTRRRDSGGNRRPGHHGRRRNLPDDHITTLHGLPITNPSRTLVDLAGRFGLPLVVAFGDFALRQGCLTAASLDSCIRACAGQRGIRRARLACELLDARAESPRESILRVILIEAGLPAPTPQFVIRSSSGDFIARGDLVYEDAKIVLEYDGEHHLTRDQQASDADRRHLLSMDGWLVVTLTALDLRDPRRAVRKVNEALDARPAAFPPRERARGAWTPPRHFGTPAHSA